MTSSIEVDHPAPNTLVQYDPSAFDLTTLYPTDMDFLVRNCKKFDVAIHAGAGHWPKWLSIKFGTVYTFESDLDRFIHLMADTAKRPNVFAMRAMLGQTNGAVTYSPDGKNIVTVPMFRIDDLMLPHCDAIIVDKGMETSVANGARNTIEKYEPQIVVGGNRIFNSRALLCQS